MKLGILLSRFPYPLEKGDKLRAFHQIKALSERNEIYLLALHSGKLKQEHLEQLKPYCKEIKVIYLSKIGIVFNIFWSLFFSQIPLQVAYFYNRKAKSKVHRFFKEAKIDHLYCQLIRVSEYVKDYRISKTLDYMDVLSQGMGRRIEKAPFYLKPFVKIEALRLKRYEHFIFKYFNQHSIISSQDQGLIVHAKNKSIHVIPNGVDQDFFKPRAIPKEHDLVFTGNMSYPPNVDGVCYIVEKILPLVWGKNPNVRLVVAGANPSARITGLVQERVIVTGWVDDIRHYYAASKVFIAPMQIGTGLQNKLLEAMAMKIPCITSTLANNALNAEPNKDILIGQNPDEYCKHILNLLSNEEEQERLSEAAHQFIQKHYNWGQTAIKLEALFLQND